MYARNLSVSQEPTVKCLGASVPAGFLSVLSANTGPVPMFKPFDGAMTAFRPVHPAIAVVTLALLTGCTAASVSAAGTSSSTAPAEVTPTTTAAATEADTTESAGTDAADASTADLGAVGTLDSTQVHEVSLSFDDADYQGMLDAYTSTGDKEWIEATVTIDGETYERAGIRLKGNSSLRSLLGGGRGPASRVSADDPTTLPWLIKLDEFVEDQQHNGLTALVVRSNNSSTALNEAVALELLDLAGLASQDAVATSFSVNGSEPVLRLVIENPDDAWMAEQLDASGALYKAESSGDYTYRGEDPQAYTEVFDQEAGDENADLTPLIELLDFVNNADDATFEAELESRLDVDSFATYLAMQELLANFDDIDGPGNNSYLYYDTETEQFTVVPWDYNLAFGTGPGGGPVVRGVAPGAARWSRRRAARCLRRQVVRGLRRPVASCPKRRFRVERVSRVRRAVQPGARTRSSRGSSPSRPGTRSTRPAWRSCASRCSGAASPPTCWPPGRTSSPRAGWWTPTP